MIRIFIDNQELDTDQSLNVSITLGVGNVEDPGNSSMAFTKSLKIPMTPRNRQVMGFVEQLYSKTTFNNSKHPARIECDGFVVMSGVAQLKDVSQEGNTGYYNVNFVGEEYKWVSEASNNHLCDLFPDLSVDMGDYEGLADFLQTEVSTLLFAPADKGGFNEADPTGESEELTRRTSLVFYDFVPFFRLKDVLAEIMKGYTIRSSLLNDSHFTNLFISGELLQQDTDGFDEEMGFMAGRAEEITLSNKDFPDDYTYFNPFVGVGSADFAKKTGKSFFSFVDTTSEEDSEDLYNNGGAFVSPEDSVSYFEAKEDCYVSLKYHIAYQTFVTFNPDAQDILSSLGYFDTVSIGDKAVRLDMNEEVDMEDKSQDMNPGYYYYLNIKDYSGGLIYRLKIWSDSTTPVYKEIPDSGKMIFSVGQPNSRAAIVKLSAPTIPVTKFSYTIIEIPLTLTYNLDLTTDPVFLPKGGRLRINTPYFTASNIYGAFVLPETYEFTLGAGCTVEAQFAQYPTVNKVLTAGDLLSHEVTQMDLVKAVQQMFNLYFYTNNITKEIFIEPRSSFFKDNAVDWRDKLDYSQSVTVEELGQDKKKRINFGYADGDEYVEQYNKEYKADYAAYHVTLDNAYAEGEESMMNSIFTPSIIEQVNGIKMIKTSTEEGTFDDMEVNIPSKIVEYQGDQSVSLNIGSNKYSTNPVRVGVLPLLAFVDPDNGVNLGFGDNRIKGLHKHYDQNIASYNGGRRITAHMKLSPVDAEQIMCPNSMMRDLRALFKIKVNGEDVMCHLEKVSDYNPASGKPTKCMFIKEGLVSVPVIRFTFTSDNAGFLCETVDPIEIDWGDGTIEKVNSLVPGNFRSHSYTDGVKDRTVTIKGGYITVFQDYSEIDTDMSHSYKSIEFSGQSGLTDLLLTNNQLTSIDLTQCPNLVTVDLRRNSLGEIRIRKDTYDNILYPELLTNGNPDPQIIFVE